MMAAKEVLVTPGEVKAAQMLIEISDDLGRPVSDSVRNIAHATIRQNAVEADNTLPSTGPFPATDQLTQDLLGTTGMLAQPSMPMDARRDGDMLVVEFDLPGVNPDSIELDVDRNVVTVKTERPALSERSEMIATERPRGVFRRQLTVVDNLDTDGIAASYDAGVLTLRIPIAEKATPRNIEISSKTAAQQDINA
jgi:HSP20 family protein